MWGAVAPIWDGNETWLVVTAVILWGAFPAVYAILMSAFYLPLVIMLSALILRGVAFEFRYKAERMRWICGAIRLPLENRSSCRLRFAAQRHRALKIGEASDACSSRFPVVTSVRN